MLEVVVFLCGAVVMILELVGSRLLAPYLGSSIIVWSSLIGTILGCLSLGYWWGGRLADRNPSHRVLAFIIFLAALTTAVIPLSKPLTLGTLQRYAGSLHLGSTLATISLFAAPSVLLGMVSPYAVRLKLKNLEATGRTVGTLYAVSSIGSIFGTFLAGFVLIAFLGSTTILFLLAGILVLASLLISLRDRLLKAAGLLVLALMGSALQSHENRLADAGFFDVDTTYNRIFIYPSVEEPTGRPLRILTTHPKAVQSAMYPDDPISLAVPYTHFYRLIEHFKPDFQNILMLGGGGYSFPKYALAHYPRAHLEVVEIDPKVTALARQFFALPETPRLSVRHQDARIHLHAVKAAYDVILGDTFGSHFAIPFHLITREAVQHLHDALAVDGAALVNLLGTIEGREGRFVRAAYRTFTAVFPQVYLFPVAAPDDPQGWQNIMLVALKSRAEPSFRSTDPTLEPLLAHLWTGLVAEDVPVLTDDYAPVDHYTATLQ